MAALFRTITYATLFAGTLLICLPARLLSWAGISRPAGIGWPQIAGMLIGSAGVVIALWCVGVFVWSGRGTPAPFDPPRRLVTRGPYRVVRNPMYIGAMLALAGTALFYESALLAICFVVFLVAVNLFVLLYEEPTLWRKFGAEYGAYCLRVRRWRPGAGSRSGA